MTSLLTEQGSHQHLLARRLEERGRLAGLQRRLAEISPVSSPRAHAALSHAAEQAAHRLAEIEAELRGEIVTPAQSLDPMTTAEAKAARRARLWHLMLTVECRAPAGCEAAVAALRTAVNAELAALDEPIRGG